MNNTIIIGKRDLKKYFKIIDNRVSKALVVFDACFSGDGVRKNDDFIRIKIFTDKEKYPYKKLVYISSSTYEAEDGAFTNVMNKCLNKNADLDGDKQITNSEIRKCIDGMGISQLPNIFPKGKSVLVF